MSVDREFVELTADVLNKKKINMCERPSSVTDKAFYARDIAYVLYLVVVCILSDNFIRQRRLRALITHDRT